MAPPWFARLVPAGRILFGLAMIGLGALQIGYADFVTRLAPSPSWLPGRPIWACVMGAVVVAAGAQIVFEIRTRQAAWCLGGVILLALVFLYLPRIAARPGVGAVWTNPCKFLALCGGAFLIGGMVPANGRAAASRAAGRRSAAADPVRRLAPLARALLGLFLTVCGVQHFVYADFVATLVPPWLPWHLFWTYLAGVALIAGGVGVVIERTTRLAAFMSGVMILLWFFSVHIPRAAIYLRTVDEWSGVFESLAFVGLCFLLAGLSPAPADTATAGAHSAAATLP
jgi:uncharacterized membrane protein